MKSKFIIFPIVMTDCVCGYSAIGIEVTKESLIEIERLKGIFTATRSYEKSITEIVFGNPTIEIHCFDVDFQHDDTLKIVELTDDEVNTYTEEPEDENSEIDAPEIVITADYFTIKCNSKHGIGELYSNVLYADLLPLIRITEKEFF